MQTSPEGVAEIIGHEGIVLSPYRDSVGVWTFGVGHTAKAGPPDPAAMDRGVTRPLGEVIDLLRRDLSRHEGRVERAVKVPLRRHQFDALVSFDFNTGGIFRARLVRLLNEGDHEGAAAAFDGWHRPAEIIPRRNAEKRLFRDGVYSLAGMASIYAAGADGRVNYRTATRINVGQLLATPREPDDPGDADERPDGDGQQTERPWDSPDAGFWGALAAAIVAVLAFFAKLAIWVSIAALIAGLVWFGWRNRVAIARVIRGTRERVSRWARRSGR